MANLNLQAVNTALQNTIQAINAITATLNGALAQVWSAFTPVELTDGATVQVDMGAAINFTLAATAGVGATRQLANPTGAKIGQRGYIVWTQDAVGGRAIAFGTQYQAAGGVASLAPAMGANAVNMFFYAVIPGPVVVLSLAANVEH